jgi:ADP-dependent NAD(P)H-hydrate dehydratase / NAD(P)H-hydrate epimerase
MTLFNEENTVLAPQFRENSKPELPEYSLSGHKYNRGHAVVFSGERFKTGASRLAAQAALKIGAGLVTLVGHAEALTVQANHVTAIMLAEITDAKALAEFMSDPRKNVICIGPAAGVNVETRENVRVALRSGAAVVLDADALTSFAENSAVLFADIQSLTSRSVIMTPHEGEFSRLFDPLINSSDSKIERARTAARISSAVIVLKGAGTVIAHPDGRVVVNTTAPPSLATAGSGDVLTGIITGLLAQGMNSFEAACAGVWLHADAANNFGKRRFTADDLVQRIGQNP